MEEQQNIVSGIEQDLRALAHEVESRKLEGEVKDLSDRQIIKEALEKIHPTNTQTTGVDDTATNAATQSNESVNSILPEYVKSASPEARLEIEYLLDDAFRDGLVSATTKAATSSPFVLDAFRDALAGRLHEELIRRGLISKE